MHMNIAITFRLITTPATPIVKRTAESARYHESCGVIGFNLASPSRGRPRFPEVSPLPWSCLLPVPSYRRVGLEGRLRLAPIFGPPERHVPAAKASLPAAPASLRRQWPLTTRSM